MDAFVDAYEVLGVDPDADQATVKAAHRRLVRHFHPDLRPEAERAVATRRVQEVNVAYGLVRDPSRRAGYDRLRRIHRTRRAATAPLRRADGDLATLDATAAAQWERAFLSAGRWAGRWWRRHRGRALSAALRARRAAVDAVFRVRWLVSTLAGSVIGFVVTSAGQRLAGVEGPLLPLTGALSGLWIGSYRGWCRRVRAAGIDGGLSPRRGTLARAAAGAAFMVVATMLDARIG